MNFWLTIIGMGVITFLLRYVLVAVAGRFELGERIQRALRYIPAAVLSTFIFTEMLQPGGNFDLSLGNFRLLAGLVAILVGWLTRNTLLTMVAGFVALWAFATLL